MTDNQTITDNPTMTINEHNLNIILPAVKILKMNRVVCLKVNKNDFYIECYEYKRRKFYKCAKIVYGFIKKNLNYLYILAQDAHKNCLIYISLVLDNLIL